jgi:hypothetical protein
VIVVIVAMLAACGGPPPSVTEQAPQTTQPEPQVAHAGTPQIPPVEFGRRPRNTLMTSDNMPFFDTVKYCDVATRKLDKSRYGPAYETCVEDQEATRIVLAQAVDANKFPEADIVRCAKDSRTAYEGLWYCLNGKPY